MADMAAATPSNEARREQMLRAAAELICERGFGETRIADVASRAGASSALVIYYFGTRDRLLVDALRYSEENFYDSAEKMLAEVTSVHDRLTLLVRATCVPEVAGDIPGAWGLWFDLWAQAFRNADVAQARVDQDGRWRSMITDVVTAAQADGDVGDVDVPRFVLTFAALLDGLSIQVALEDPQLDSDTAYEIAMDFAERELKLPARAAKRVRKRAATTSARTKPASRKTAPRKAAPGGPSKAPAKAAAQGSVKAAAQAPPKAAAQAPPKAAAQAPVKAAAKAPAKAAAQTSGRRAR